MTNNENLRSLHQSMIEFSTAFDRLTHEINEYERETGKSVNDIPNFVKSYPFAKSLDEIDISEWVRDIVEYKQPPTFTILNYTYLNTGGNCMVGVFEVWLPEEKRVVYALTNEEGCTLSVVDYIQHYIGSDDYDELILEYVDWGRVTGHEKYFELYRYCLNAYTKDDCRHFGYTRNISYLLLSDELQQQVDEDYLEWCKENNNWGVDTDGVKIIKSEYYSELDHQLKELKEFADWHETMVAVERLYEDNYVLTFDGKTVRIPYNADTWTSIGNLLRATIEEW